MAIRLEGDEDQSNQRRGDPLENGLKNDDALRRHMSELAEQITATGMVKDARIKTLEDANRNLEGRILELSGDLADANAEAAKWRRLGRRGMQEAEELRLRVGQQRRWVHSKTRGHYYEVARAKVQASTRPIVEDDEIVVYQGSGPGGGTYARRTGEFEDGRFITLDQWMDKNAGRTPHTPLPSSAMGALMSAGGVLLHMMDPDSKVKSNDIEAAYDLIQEAIEATGAPNLFPKKQHHRIKAPLPAGMTDTPENRQKLEEALAAGWGTLMPGKVALPTEAEFDEAASALALRSLKTVLGPAGVEIDDVTVKTDGNLTFRAHFPKPLEKIDGSGTSDAVIDALIKVSGEPPEDKATQSRRILESALAGTEWKLSDFEIGEDGMARLRPMAKPGPDPIDVNPVPEVERVVPRYRPQGLDAERGYAPPPAEPYKDGEVPGEAARDKRRGSRATTGDDGPDEK